MSKKNILLECDTFTPSQLSHWIKHSGMEDKYYIYILIKPPRVDAFRKAFATIKDWECIVHEDLFAYQHQSSIELNAYFDFIKGYLNDQFTSRLLDRQGYFPKYGIGVQNGLGYCTDVAYNLLCFLKEKNIELVYFRNTPHETGEWMLAKTADFLGIDIYTSERFVLPWLFTISKGFMKDRKIAYEDFQLNPEDELRQHITKFVQIVSDKYDLAMPSYEKNRLGKGLLKYYNPFKNIPHTLKRPHEFVNKTVNFFYYKKQAKEIDFENTKYIVFFLHYQPERSTLPEGFDFTDQFYAIKILSMMLPEGVQLIVKEHPSMFTRQSVSKFRSLYQYKSLKRLDNVVLCKMHTDNFQLIDHSLAVVTVTGTAAVEAYIRKKPVIMLGLNNLKVNGVHGFESIDQLKAFVHKAVEGRIQIDKVVENLVRLCVNKSATGLTQSADEDIDYYLKYIYQENAHYELLSKLLLET